MKKREKSSGTGSSTTEKKKPQADVPASLLKNLIIYLFSEYRKRSSCKKALIYFRSIDLTSIHQDPDLDVYYRLANCVLASVVDDGISSRYFSIYAFTESVNDYAIQIVGDLSYIVTD